MLIRTKFLLAGILFCSVSYSQIKITLRKSFIDSFKNKVTIDADYAIFYAHPSPNAAKDDGDLHFSGYDKKIGLPTVAEVMNAADEQEALDTIHANEGKGKPDNTITLTGVWRLWAEHISTGTTYAQGMGSKTIKNTNPNHVFEIHPATSIKGIDLISSLRDIEGYEAEPKKAFPNYLSRPCNISSTTKKITIQTRGALYNYADFWIRLLSTEKFKVDDGLFVYCDVLDAKFKPGVHNVSSKTITFMIRMAFVKGSEAYNTVKDMQKDEFLHVIAIPRISLIAISQRVSSKKNLSDKLPFEMIVVGIKE